VSPISPHALFAAHSIILKTLGISFVFKRVCFRYTRNASTMTFNTLESTVSQFQLDPKRAEALRFYRQNQHNLALYMQTANNSSIVPFDCAAWRELPMKKLERFVTCCHERWIISHSTDEQLMDLNPRRQTILTKRCNEEKPSRQKNNTFPYTVLFVVFLFFLFVSGPVPASVEGRTTSGVSSQGLPVAKDVLEVEWAVAKQQLDGTGDEDILGDGFSN